ncbi:hypothetical protein [Streptomyces sp. NBC_01622]|uniref:hypothetical protein n=1 Tax=Streptomyces sp. NBC_01622 TaxID=2975903 RepID=UPI003868BCA1
MAEALNGTFKAELIEMQGPWKDPAKVERAILRWITWYNEERCTPRSTTCHQPSTNATSGRASSRPHSPPETRSLDSTKLGAAHPPAPCKTTKKPSADSSSSPAPEPSAHTTPSATCAGLDTEHSTDLNTLTRLHGHSPSRPGNSSTGR